MTKPQLHSLPSASRSNQRPPANGSMMASVAIVSPMWWLSSGHHVLKPAVKTSNARSGVALTVMLRRAATVVSVMSPPSRPRA